MEIDSIMDALKKYAFTVDHMAQDGAEPHKEPILVVSLSDLESVLRKYWRRLDCECRNALMACTDLWCIIGKMIGK